MDGLPVFPTIIHVPTRADPGCLRSGGSILWKGAWSSRPGSDPYVYILYGDAKRWGWVILKDVK